MAQIFRPRATPIARNLLLALVVLVLAAVGIWIGGSWSTYLTQVGLTPDQPVPFSHRHHVSGLGLDCRYCHTSVEKSPFAGIPPTEICMTCHSQLWTHAAMLAPVRESLRKGEPIAWSRVIEVPGYVYFNHSIHIQKGVGCATCHGQVDEMALTYKAIPMTMGFCLECHRNPARYIRPKRQVFNMDWNPPDDRIAMGKRLMRRYHIQTAGLTDCTVCHR